MTTPSAITSTEETVPVLDEHRFDERSLSRYLAGHVDGYTPPLEVAQCMGGMSNPTFVLRDGNGRRYVLRKKPPGRLLASAHAVDREFRVISALRATDVPVADAYVYCDDESVIGQAFYVMEFVDGRVFRNPALPDLEPPERHAIYDAMNDVLARLHTVDFAAIGLGDYGRIGGYITRQINRWTQQYAATRTEDIAAMEALTAWLPEHIPDDTETAIAHGDYRLENMIFDAAEPRVLAVVDWELATLGNPLADLAYNCLPYHMPYPTRGDLIGLDFGSYGIPDEQTYLADYCRRTGRGAIDHWPFYLVLSLFRIAAIVQGVYFRGLQGNAPSPEALKRKDQCRQWSELAWAIAQDTRANA